MAINQQRILKSKYLAYRYFCNAYKDNHILAYDKLEEDALNKVNALIGELKEVNELKGEELEMFNSNLYMTINNLITVSEPVYKGSFYSNYKLYSLKTDDKRTPKVIVLNKRETIIYTINKILNEIEDKVYNNAAKLIKSIGTSKILEITNMTRADYDDEIAYARSTYNGYSSNAEFYIFLALVNSKKIELVVEYLLMTDRYDIFRCITFDLENHDGLEFPEALVKSEGKYYYIIPFAEHKVRTDRTMKSSVTRGKLSTNGRPS